ncbi:MAG TPA: glycosyltransferase family 39 protein, partial [Pirellulales bacterium]|nr:glycosyltransferase family 39 protein [Pirellulales bacterium]
MASTIQRPSGVSGEAVGRPVPTVDDLVLPRTNTSPRLPSGLWRLDTLARHADWLLLLVLGLTIYVSRIGTLTIRGEEPRRIRITCEMLERGNLFVQTEQGEIFAERPPLCNWFIALGILATGSDSVVPARLFSAAATIATSLLLYFYARGFLGRVGAIAAGASFLTMGEVMHLGGMAENEAIMAFLLGAALVVWEWGYRRGWPAGRTWTLAYALAALATLAKGLQAPTYFVGGVALFLLIRRDGRFLLSRAHAAGVCLFVLLVALWQLPYWCCVGSDVALGTWTNLLVEKTQGRGADKFARHVAEFPWEFFGSMLPWSMWLLAFASPRLRASLNDARRGVAVFIACVSAVAFPSVWFASGGRARHLMPLLPLIAVLVGMAIDHAWQAAANSPLRRAWSKSLQLAGAVAMLAGVAVAEFVIFTGSTTPSAVRWRLVTYAASALLCGAIAWQARRSTDESQARSGVLAWAFFVAVTFVLPYTDIVVCNASDSLGPMRAVVAQIPAEADMVSLGS